MSPSPSLFLPSFLSLSTCVSLELPSVTSQGAGEHRLPLQLGLLGLVSQDQTSVHIHDSVTGTKASSAHSTPTWAPQHCSCTEPFFGDVFRPPESSLEPSLQVGPLSLFIFQMVRGYWPSLDLTKTAGGTGYLVTNLANYLVTKN